MSSEKNLDVERMQELQMIEQNLGSLSMQKQAFDFELSETEHALEELSESSGDVFKIVGQIMVKSDKDKLKLELEKKVKLLNLRIKSLDAQEKEIVDHADAIRGELSKKKSQK